jgi:tryptophan synthase alpha chain
LTAGFPDRDQFLVAVEAVIDAGADLIEIGIPFSDPLADGPTIQRASQESIRQGTTLLGTLETLKENAERVTIPVILMTYLNPIQRIGIDRFCSQASAAGVAGVLVSDLTPDQDHPIARGLADHGLDRIVMVAPTTPQRRIDRILPEASGFVYCVTRTGVTGAGGEFSSRLEQQVERIRTRCSLPVIGGFGIRSIDDVGRLSDLFDGVIIGAKLVEILEEAKGEGAIREDLARFLRPIRERLDSR